MKENGPGRAGPGCVLKSEKLTIVIDKIKPFKVYISNSYKYLIIRKVIFKKRVAY